MPTRRGIVAGTAVRALREIEAAAQVPHFQDFGDDKIATIVRIP